MEKLRKELCAESESFDGIDYPEFKCSMNNLGIDYDKKKLKSLFGHFLAEQREKKLHQKNKSIKKTNKYELNLDFFINSLKEKVKNYKNLTPKQILQIAFSELLYNTNNLKKRQSFL